MRRLAAATSTSFMMFCVSLAAQDLEPRAYSNSPIGLHFVDVGYAYSTGKFLTDPSLPVENVSIASHIGVFGGATVLNLLGQSAKLELVIPYAFGRWTVELAPAVTFYTDNGDFFGGRTREQAPLYSAQAHVSYTFASSFWLGLDAAYFNGGRTTVNDVENDDRLEGTRFGVTLALPVNRYHSIKLYAATGYNAHRQHDFEALGIAWQTRWGGGY